MKLEDPIGIIELGDVNLKCLIFSQKVRIQISKKIRFGYRISKKFYVRISNFKKINQKVRISNSIFDSNERTDLHPWS